MIDALARGLEREIKTVPDDFYSTFRFTQTGRNLTHPKTLAFLAKVLWQLQGVESVGIDVRINERNGLKLQPDLVAFGKGDKYLLMVDYESPNSSDARVPVKDVEPFLGWAAKQPEPPTYVIITTLPDAPAPAWELRYTNGYNRNYRGRTAEVRANPCAFWYGEYRQALRSKDLHSVAFLNIDRRSVVRQRT